MARHAELVFRGGNVITLGAAPKAQAVAVEGDRISIVGSDADASARIGPSTHVIELDGRTLMPGMVEAHGHLTWPTSVERMINTMKPLYLFSSTGYHLPSCLY